MTGEDARAVWLRWGGAEKVWLEQGYDLARYMRGRASGAALQDWLAGRAAGLPSVDVAAALKKCAMKMEKMMAPRGANPAKRGTGAAQVSAAGGERAPLPPTSLGALNKELEAAQKKVADINAKKQKVVAEERKRTAAKNAAAKRPSATPAPLPSRRPRRH